MNGDIPISFRFGTEEKKGASHRSHTAPSVHALRITLFFRCAETGAELMNGKDYNTANRILPLELVKNKLILISYQNAFTYICAS